ncbi:MAG: PAS domain-containing protein, partial [Desulfobacterales bacterium]
MVFSGFNDSPFESKVKNFMRSMPSILTEDANLKDAIKIIVEEKIDAVPIVNHDDNLTGIVTKTHVLRAIYKTGSLDTGIMDVMKHDPLTTTPEYDSIELVKIPIGSIPVLEDSRILGLVTISETVRACFTSFAMLLEELKSIITSTPNGILTSDTKGRVRIINSQAEEMLNMPRREVFGKRISNNFLRLNVMEVINTGKTIVGKKFFYKDKIFFVSFSPIKHFEKVIGAKAVLQNISHFDSISEELKYTKELKSYLDSIIESSFDGVYLTDTFGKIIRVNDAFTRITGIPKEEILYKTSAELVEEGIFKSPMPLEDISK